MGMLKFSMATSKIPSAMLPFSGAGVILHGPTDEYGNFLMGNRDGVLFLGIAPTQSSLISSLAARAHSDPPGHLGNYLVLF